MAWPLVCLFLLTVCSGSLSQLVLTQPSSASSSLGATAKLTCTLSSGFSNYGVGWHQQSPGKAPRYIMWVKSDGSVSRADGIPDRFSGSSSGDNRYLSISNIQPEDEADYYCGADYTIGSSKGYSQWYSHSNFSELAFTRQPCFTQGCYLDGLLPEFSCNKKGCQSAAQDAETGQNGQMVRVPEVDESEAVFHKVIGLTISSRVITVQWPDTAKTTGDGLSRRG
ncbi:immunoglobulin omega chain-like [Dromiciops gliroides]|uniref:immunoglobulin omega chain-like n=1 Tax=Dromiciops gliroides TaxID=33562 RepID=UPI001CC62F83|nr:immunoglobulin omega chain-like [Dromiciops gliroides]